MSRLSGAVFKAFPFLSMFAANSAFAQASYLTGACANLNSQAIAVSSAENWVAGEQIGKKEVAVCSSQYPNFILSDFYSFLAVMQYNQSHFKDSLSTADACIAIYYRAPVHPRRRTVSIRAATVADIPRLREIRGAVRENALRDPGRVRLDDHQDHLGRLDQTWVDERGGTILGFSAATRASPTIWGALRRSGARTSWHRPTTSGSRDRLAAGAGRIGSCADHLARHAGRDFLSQSRMAGRCDLGRW